MARNLRPDDQRIAGYMRAVPADKATALEAARTRAIRLYLLGLPPIRRRRD